MLLVTNSDALVTLQLLSPDSQGSQDIGMGWYRCSGCFCHACKMPLIAFVS